MTGFTKPTKDAGFNHAPKPIAPEPMHYVTRGGVRMLVRYSLMTPAEKAAIGTAAPAAAAPAVETPAPAAPTPPPAPTRDQFGNYQDADYWTGLAGLRNQLGLIQNPDGSLVSQAAQQRLSQLGQRVDPTTFKPVTDGVGGKTLYDILYGKQQEADTRSYLSNGDQAGKQGLMRSGWRDQQLNDLAGQSASAMDKLMRDWGTDLTDSRSAAYQASQDQTNAIRNYTAGQGDLSKAAADRGWGTALSNYQNTYGGYA